MKKLLSAFTVILAVVMMIVPAAAYEDYDCYGPGDTVKIDSSYFMDRDEINIDTRVPFNSSYFEVSNVEFAKGKEYISSVKMDKNDGVLITFTDEPFGIQDRTPNVIIKKIDLKATRSKKDSDGSFIIRMGDKYKMIEPMMFTAGMETEVEDVDDSTEIEISDGERRVLEFDAITEADIIINFGDMAYGTTRVYRGDKGVYSFSSEVPNSLERHNPDKFIESIDLGDEDFAEPLTLYINANKEDYLYYYENGTLKPIDTARWDSDEYAWKLRLTSGRHIVVSDEPLKDINEDNFYTTDEKEQEDMKNYNKSQNPNTGRYASCMSISISAIVGIVAVAVVSTVFIFSGKSPKKTYFVKKIKG